MQGQRTSWAAISGMILLVLPHVHSYRITEEILIVPIFVFTIHYNAHIEHVRQRQIPIQILESHISDKMKQCHKI